MPRKTIDSVLREHAARLLAIDGVEGAAIGKYGGKPCISVYITGKAPERLQQIPANLEGYRVKVEESGNFRALGTE